MTPKGPIVRHPDEGEEFATPERCHILETWNRIDDPTVSIARARVAAGVTTRLHRLIGTEERYYVLSGRGEVEVADGPPRVVVPGDLVYIPPDCPQRIGNPGPGDLVFLAVCTPRFVPAAYEDIDPEERGPATMAKIHIKRAHSLGLEDAKTQVTALADDIKKELNVSCQWRGNQLHFERSGASGTIDVGVDYIELDIKLGMALALLKTKIEDRINRKLDASIGAQGGTRVA